MGQLGLYVYVRANNSDLSDLIKSLELQLCDKMSTVKNVF